MGGLEQLAFFCLSFFLVLLQAHEAVKHNIASITRADRYRSKLYRLR